MALSYEWYEYHLTEKGWIEGSYKLDIVGITKRKKPANSLITRKYKEYASSRFSGLEMTYTETVNSKDRIKITTLLGIFPHPKPVSRYKNFSLEK